MEVVGFVTNDSDTPHSSGYDFMAVWKMPDKQAAIRFETLVEESGEQVNARGAAMGMDAVVVALLSP